MNLPASLRALILLALLSLALASDVLAQSRAGGPRPFRIYAITFRGMTEVEKGFTDYFAARHIPVEVTFRDLNRDPSRMAGFVEEIRQTKPDLVYTWGTPVTLALVGAYDAVDPAKHITDIPVVFTMVAAPVLAKVVPELAGSRRNVTGVFHVAPTEAQVRAMASYRPFKTLGLLYTPSEQNSVVVLDELRRISRKLGINVVAQPFRTDANRKATSEGAPEMIRKMKADKVEWLYLLPDSFLSTQAKNVIIPAAHEAGLPTFASVESFMEAGALTGLVSRFTSIGQFTAYKAEQILVRKIPPSRIPVETLTRFSLQVNMNVAEALKLPPPLPMFNFAELLTPNSPAPAPVPAPAAPSTPAPGK
jgi:putative tryptophan/tyrosine transport system substrate-binding protein